MKFRSSLLCASLAGLLSACGSAGEGGVDMSAATEPVTVRIVAFNDLHGHIEPLAAEFAFFTEEGEQKAYAGGAATLASAVAGIRAENPNVTVVSAGDLFGSSQLASALFLDEPTIEVMNRIGLDFNAVGNHEFDKGTAELLRMQNGGCEKLTELEPCALEPFEGADFQFLAANVTRDGEPIFPASGLKRFGSGENEVTIGVIGLTLRATPLATEGSIEELAFAREAETINAEAKRLRAQGADAIIVAMHQGLTPFESSPLNGCGGIAGPLRSILDELEPGVDVVLSGHTHRAYVCDYSTVDPDRPMLVTSAYRTGFMFTDITLQVNAGLGRVTSKDARNVVLQRKARDAKGLPAPHNPAFDLYEPDEEIELFVERYAKVARQVAAQVAQAEQE